MGRSNRRANDETPQGRAASPPEPAEGSAPPAALGDVEDAVAEEVDGALTHWAPSGSGRIDGSDEREPDERGADGSDERHR